MAVRVVRAHDQEVDPPGGGGGARLYDVHAVAGRRLRKMDGHERIRGLLLRVRVRVRVGVRGRVRGKVGAGVRVWVGVSPMRG